MKTRARTKIAAKTKAKTTQYTITRGMATLMVSGALLAAAAAGFNNIKINKSNLHTQATSYPYQTVGYTLGYVPGYIPGRVPGYGVPGYVPGYGTFEILSTPDFIRKTLEAIRARSAR